MTDIVKGVLGGGWSLVVGWFLPTGLVLGLFGVLVVPSLTDVPLLRDVHGASAASQGVILLVASVVVGLVLSVAQTPLFRLLEGYLLWPARMQDRQIERYKRRRQETEERLRSGVASNGRLPISLALEAEKLHRYPDDPEQIAPTRLGNAIRRFECYAQNRYQLDSQLLWYQLRAAAPERLANEVDNSRVGADFFVCLLYMSLFLGCTSLAAFLHQPDGNLVLFVVAMVAVASTVLWYRGAVAATDAWAAAVRALVDLGRVELARTYGLTLPSTVKEERSMWQAVGWFTGYAYHPDGASLLDAWRARSSEAAPHASAPDASASGSPAPDPA